MRKKLSNFFDAYGLFLLGAVFGIFLVIFMLVALRSVKQNQDTPIVIGKEENAVVVPITTEETTTQEETTIEEITANIKNEKIEEVEEPQIMCGWGNFRLSIAEYRLLCATVYCETGHQSIDTQILAALCILNRRILEEFPNNIIDVVYQPGAFEVTKYDLWNIQWDEQTEMAVTYALEVNNHPYDLTCFNLNYYHDFGTHYCNIGSAYFTRYIPQKVGK